jgi:hypothetical protein
MPAMIGRKLTMMRDAVYTATSISTGRCGLNIDKQLEDILLFAYADGQVSKNQRRFVEAVLARDPDMHQRIAEIHELNTLIKAAYKDGDQTI